MDVSLRRKIWLLNLVLVAGGIAYGARTLTNGFGAKGTSVPDDALASLAPPPAKEAPEVPAKAVVTQASKAALAKASLAKAALAKVEPLVTPLAPEAAPAAPSAPSAPAAPAPAAPAPAAPVAPTPAAPVAPAPPPPITSLPLALLGTSVVAPSRYSSALVADSTQRSSTYWVGDMLPGAGPVVAISGAHVDFENRNSHRIERLDLGEHRAEAAPSPMVPVATSAGAAPKTDLDTQMDSAIKQVDANHYKIDRAFVDNMLGNPAVLMGTLRARPMPAANGVPGGLKIAGVKPGTAAARIGLQNGDTINTINGNEMGGDLDKMLEMYTKLKSAHSLSITVTRGGKPMQLDYAIQ